MPKNLASFYFQLYGREMENVLKDAFKWTEKCIFEK